MTAAEVKDALRRRHPAAAQGSMVGQWTCLEEWANVDLIALNAWSAADVVGYEVKVSRSDYRQELLAPAKRADAVAMCTEFYFAVPEGLLKPDELAYVEPEWEPEDWERMRCPGIPAFGPPSATAIRRHRPQDLLDTPPGRYGGPCRGCGWTGTYKSGTREKGPFTLRLPAAWADTSPPDYVVTKWGTDGRVPLEGEQLRVELERWALNVTTSAEESVPCPACGGKGYLNKSRVEAEAPTLWVPRDVGLIEITRRGCRITRKSPRRPHAPGLVAVNARSPKGGRVQVAQLIRWASNRPDPRHVAQLAPMLEAVAA